MQKVQGQRSLGSKVRVETDGWTDERTEAIALPPVLMRSVKINCILLMAFPTFLFQGPRCMGSGLSTIHTNMHGR